MSDQTFFRNEDLVLKVSLNVDPTKFDINRYEPFLDGLCGTREYQKDAIRNVLRYYLGGKYQSLRQLAQENHVANIKLQERHGAFSEMDRVLQLPDQLSCSIDLATATGKSYVMYGIARIMLAHGSIDRVLIMCPSRTIEKGLIEKFRALSNDITLKTLLPEESHIRNPHIINATESITPGTICVENFHAALEHVNSSIKDSLTQKGDRTLVLNDEVHHVYNQSGQDFKRWKEFLLSSVFNFRYVAGFSGTCYIGNQYFTDVIYRYPLRKGIEQGYCKSIDYVANDSSVSEDEKFQKIYDNHIQNKLHFYRKVKPLTILITRDIAAARRLTMDLVHYIAQQENIPSEVASKKVLIVTSATEHQTNLIELESVDNAESPIEWIVSVSMLTEGWDVQNVFQIVPHEERAFNSKLLISQVLGRGLRIPNAYRGEKPVVTVFNHDAWSPKIKHLVDEVMEVEKRVYSYPIDKENSYHFPILHIDYTKRQEVEEFPQTGEYEFNKGFINLVSQVSSLERETTYARVGSNEYRHKKTLVNFKMFTVDDVAEHIHAKLKAIDLEEDTKYADKYSFEWFQLVIRESLRRVGETEDRVSEENRNRIQGAFGVIHRKSSQTVRYHLTPKSTLRLQTADRNRNSIGVASLRRGEGTVFLDDISLLHSDNETRLLLREIVEDESLPRSAVERVSNCYHFKTPLNLVVTDHKPERDFVRQLIKAENCAALDAWIKSTDQDFYQIEYAWRRGDKAKRGLFNPDFFIKSDNYIIVVEIKGDEEITEPSAENKAKYRAARNHFDTLNTLQQETIYRCHFLTPKDYDVFFRFLREKNYSFVSELEVVLAANGGL